MHYERLLEDLPGETDRLCAFLGLEWDANMLSFHEGRQRAGSELSAKKAWLPPTRGLRDWRQQMQPEALAGFEAVAGSLLVSLGYELRDPQASPELVHRAEALRARFSRRPWPRAWS